MKSVNQLTTDSQELRVTGMLEDAIGYFKASNTGGSFGYAVSLSADGETMVVSDSREASAATGINGLQADTSAESAGAVYVFTRDEGGWQQQAYIKASNADDGDQFSRVGISLSADGNSLAVGAAGEDSVATGIGGDQDDNSGVAVGAVYLY